MAFVKMKLIDVEKNRIIWKCSKCGQIQIENKEPVMCGVCKEDAEIETTD